MKSAKILIIFTFLLAVAFQVSAQDDKPKIVWKNVQEKYENFEDIKPVIENLSDKTIYLYDSYYSIRIIFFDEAKKDWTTVYPFICVTGLKLKSNKVIKQTEFGLILKKGFWHLNIQPDDGLNLIESYGKEETGRFKLELSFGLKKSFPYSFTSTSPEFQLKIPKS